MAIKKILLVASFLLLLLSTHANTAYFKHLSVQDGLSQVNIISIYQDETGALWFGSFEGINRYNGQSVTVFHPSQDNIGLTENEIMAICGNKKGNVYIQALHDLVCYNTRTQQFHKLRANNVSNIYYKNDTLWIAGRNKLEFRVEGDSTIRLLTTFKENIRVSSPICCTDDGYIHRYEQRTSTNRPCTTRTPTLSPARHQSAKSLSGFSKELMDMYLPPGSVSAGSRRFYPQLPQPSR